LHLSLGVAISDDNGPLGPVFKATPGAVGQYTAGIENIGVERPATISGRKALPLWSLARRPAAAAVRHGAGRVLLVADPSVFTHRGLLREDNALFLYNVAALDAQGGRVYFDEYHRGIRSGGGYWNYLRYHDQQWIILHLLALGGITLWAVGRRLGPAAPMPVVQRADGVDYAASVARIYEKADARPLVAGIYALNFLDALTSHLRLRRSAGAAEIVAAWKQRYGAETSRELPQLLDAAHAVIQGENGSAKYVLALARRFDAFLPGSGPLGPKRHGGPSPSA
jgi:hypothetical protein